jgi:hypothetical protein
VQSYKASHGEKKYGAMCDDKKVWMELKKSEEYLKASQGVKSLESIFCKKV